MITRRLAIKCNECNVTIIRHNYIWMSHHLSVCSFLKMIAKLANLMSWEARANRVWRRTNEWGQVFAYRSLHWNDADAENARTFVFIYASREHASVHAKHGWKPCRSNVTWESTACPLAGKWTGKRLSVHASMLRASLRQEKLTYTSRLSERDTSSGCIISQSSDGATATKLCLQNR